MSRLVENHPRWLGTVAVVSAVAVVLGLMVWVEGDFQAAGQLLASGLFLPVVMMTVYWSEESKSPVVSSPPLMATPKVVERTDDSAGRRHAASARRRKAAR